MFSCKGGRRELHFAHQRAALQEELQLAHRQAQPGSAERAPQAGEAALLQALAVDAQTRAVPQQHLGQMPAAVDEQEQIPRQRILPEIPSHQGRQAVEALSQVDR